MDFFSNIIKTTVNKVETLGKSATAAVNSLSPTSEENQPPEEQPFVEESTEDASGKIQRSSSGDTSGPDYDEQCKKSADDTDGADKASFNSNEMYQKAQESAKSFGNFLFNVANKAGQTVSATAKQLKSTVESVGMMQEFTKEQQDFIKEHGGNTELAEPPWVGCEEEEKVKTEILALSQDKRNFVRNPPAGVEFYFDMATSYPIALALLKEDPELARMRYAIVPKLVNEESFWRNYFYRVSLIKQDPNFTTAVSHTAWSGSRSSSSEAEGPDDPNEQSESVADNEFVSDSFQPSNISVDDVRKDMYKLGIHQTADEMDEELAKDLQEFEVVPGNETNKVDDDEINRELENFDLK